GGGRKQERCPCTGAERPGRPPRTPGGRPETRPADPGCIESYQDPSYIGPFRKITESAARLLPWVRGERSSPARKRRGGGARVTTPAPGRGKRGKEWGPAAAHRGRRTGPGRGRT